MKNTLVLLLMVYRLYVLFDSRRGAKKARDKAEYLNLDDLGSQRSTDQLRRKDLSVSVDDDVESPRSTDQLKRKPIPNGNEVEVI